jgi:hypothetical protein
VAEGARSRLTRRLDVILIALVAIALLVVKRPTATVSPESPVILPKRQPSGPVSTDVAVPARPQYPSARVLGVAPKGQSNGAKPPVMSSPTQGPYPGRAAASMTATPVVTQEDDDEPQDTPTTEPTALPTTDGYPGRIPTALPTHDPYPGRTASAVAPPVQPTATSTPEPPTVSP